MSEQSKLNKVAWEHRAYEFWNIRDGEPNKKAEEILKNPKECLKNHQKYFEDISEKKIANLCGSNGRKAIPLALMGANVTVFDISDENKKYALELAECAKTSINYIVCDLYNIDTVRYNNYFDILYLEGGILHYFNDIAKLMSILYAILKPGGKMILSDFHPFRKCVDTGGGAQGSYFDTELHNGDVAYKKFFNKEEQETFPDCLLRFYTISEIINSVIESCFILKKFDEQPNFENTNIPGEFTILAEK